MTQLHTILIVDDTPANIGVLLDNLAGLGYKVLVARNGESALEKVTQEWPDLILLDIMMPGMDGFEVCGKLKNDPETKDIPVIFMTALSETSDKVKGFNAGAVDYITKPFQSEEVRSRVATHLRMKELREELETEVEYRKKAQKSLEEINETLEQRVDERTRELKSALGELNALKEQLQGRVHYLEEEMEREGVFCDIIGESQALKAVLEKVSLVAPTDSTVLITGESGTGKELVARAIHMGSQRKDAPMIKVNCGAITSSLVESELFGHEKGAFTGAVSQRKGRFELADGGTLFLDEIGELSPEIQVKLLRVLQEGELERLGGSKTIKVDVRVLCATHVNLAEKVKEGQFREDLYYRLNVFPIQNPPLRERVEDLPLLVDFFLGRLSVKMGKQVTQVSEEVMQLLRDYAWPGNIRELQNTLERAVILCKSNVITSCPLPDVSTEMKAVSDQQTMETLDDLEAYERKIYLKALYKAEWKIGGSSGAAELLGRPVSTVRDRVRKLGLKPGMSV
jgi:DNA-binding NtrC family response regulator